MVFKEWQEFPVLTQVAKPKPGPGEVLLKVAAAGACHSDVSIYRKYDATTSPALQPPFILGHESSGWIEEVGEGLDGFRIGDAYLVYGPIGCGRCRMCVRGQDPYCENAHGLAYKGIGLGRDGGMAEYVVVPGRNLVPLGNADPVAAAPLADAGLTPYHAVKQALPHLAGGGKTALVIGLGGLGQFAVQILKALTGATIIATDVKAEAMKRAEDLGAITVPPAADQAEAIRAMTNGRGVDAAFDLVGSTSTIKSAAAVMAQGSKLTVVGIAGGVHQWNFFGTPYESSITNTYWGTIDELHELVAMYVCGQVGCEIETFTLDNAPEAYRRLEAGTLSGRAVILPHDRN